MSLKLSPNKITFGIYREGKNTGFMEGEIEVIFDSHDTAWIHHCSRVTITEEIIDLLADKLAPLGIVWIRGWKKGPSQGRYIGDLANGYKSRAP